MRRFWITYATRSSLWLVPALCILGGAGLAAITIAIDRGAGDHLIPHSVTGSATDVQTILSTIATAMVSLSTIVLTVTLVVVQLAMGQFSPRIVRALLEDRRNQAAVGLFFTTFIFAIVALREVDDQAGTVPGLTVLVCYLMTLASLAALVLFVHHASQALRVSGLVDLVGDETRAQIDRRYPGPQPVYDDTVITRPDPGVIMFVDHDGLVALARRADCVLELVPTMGEFVPSGAPLFRVMGDPQRIDRAAAVALVAVGPERTHHEEPAYGLRKLVDMAERAIAQPFNDPTTTVQVIHRLQDCLRLLAVRPFPSGEHVDADGRVRLTVRALDWDGYVRLAFDELRLAGARVPTVTRRLVAALEDLKTLAPPERQEPLDRQLELLRESVRNAYDDPRDIAAALTADPTGLGSGPDVTSVDHDRPSKIVRPVARGVS
jgi:uncharacterized membrane protein